LILIFIENYDKFKETYNVKNKLCGEELGRIYNSNTNKLTDVLCMKWNCEVCRPIKKMILYFQISQNVLIFDLDKHFVITSEGKQFRNKYGWYHSYIFMTTQWKKFLKAIKYEFGDIDYILLPRAQKDGFCHYHIMLNKYIPWNFLNEKRKNYGLGYLRINKNQSVVDYLHNDYFKDNEWIIPDGIKHYRSSRSILINNVAANNEIQYFNNQTNLKQISEFVNILYGKNIDIEGYYEFKNAKKEFRDYFKNLKNKYPELNRVEIKNICNKILPDEIYNILNKKEIVK
jgi:hypothetical protein